MVIALTNNAQSYAKTKHFQQKLSFSCKKVRNHCNASEIFPDFIVVVFGSFDIRLDNTFTHVCPISAVLCDVPWFVRVCFCFVVIFLACRRIAGSCSSDALYMFKLRARNRAPQGQFSRQCSSESPMSGEYFGRLNATGECWRLSVI